MPGTAVATTQRGQQFLWTHCYQGWNADWGSGVTAYANGNGYAQVSWAAWTQVTSRGYYNDGRTAGYPDRSCDWPSNFLGMWFGVTQDGQRMDGNGYGQSAETDASRGSYMQYPTEGTTWVIQATHGWADSERCGLSWHGDTHGDAEVPHYTPHPPDDLGLSSQLGPITEVYSTGTELTAPLVADATNVEMPVGIPLIGNSGLVQAARNWVSTGVTAHEIPPMVEPDR